MGFCENGSGSSPLQLRLFLQKINAPSFLLFACNLRFFTPASLHSLASKGSGQRGLDCRQSREWVILLYSFPFREIYFEEGKGRLITLISVREVLYKNLAARSAEITTISSLSSISHPGSTGYQFLAARSYRKSPSSLSAYNLYPLYK